MPGSERAGPEPRKQARQKRESATRASERGSTEGTRRRTTKSSSPHRSEGDGPEPKKRASSPHRLSGRRAAARAAQHVRELADKDLEAVTSLEKTDEGWQVGIEVVETHRIPDSTDILAVYLVEMDDEGELISYRREKRHYRGRAERSDA
ncbi:gas vesicle protein GvpO [Streptomyces sp. SLBN-118]|uniref:gas vesicle protein GvpO n=1 Tax=Streptomyces sp. SLBN-118 TaxID=2768454 RepID=UPI0011514AED|nr:gas vesicle protein GvpO [Streptomyces sp. SLBN-118]TQK42646.1 gas vesicle protein GvpO [Streptomyces sp. SLBN-118]